MSDYAPDEPIDVLLVEDNPGDVRLTREAFGSVDSEIEFQVVHDGEQAVSRLRSCSEKPDQRPDLILLDLNLPRTDGFDVLETLDEAFDHPPPPVLALSSSTDEGDIAECYENCVNAYLVKPDDPIEFDSMARAIEDFWIETVRQPPVPQ